MPVVGRTSSPPWRRRVHVVALSTSLLVLSACEESVTASLDPKFAESPFGRCSEDDGIRICLPDEPFKPGDCVPLTVTNALDRIVSLDGCTGGVEGFRMTTQDWGGPSSGRACLQLLPGDPPARAYVLARMRYLPRNELVYDTMWVNSLAFD